MSFFRFITGPNAKFIRQPVFDTPLTSPLEIITTAPVNEIINGVYFYINGDIMNFRMEWKSVATGEVVLSYPDKFRYDRDDGEDIIGAGEKKIDFYYSNRTTPTRILQGEQFDIVAKWDASPGTLMGVSTILPPSLLVSGGGFPYYGIDLQEFEFNNLVTQTELDALVFGKYRGVYADLVALQTAIPIGNDGDTATVVSPNNNLFYWDGANWTDSGTGYIGDMLQAVYDPTGKNADAFDMENMSESTTKKILSLTERNKLASITDIGSGVIISTVERTNLSNQSGTNTGDVTLNADDTTQETLNLAGQELQVNLVTTATDGVMSAEDKDIFDKLVNNSAGDSWVSGLATSENDPKDQTITYGAGSYLINGVLKAIASSGVHDLTSLYATLVNEQHAFVNIYVDNDEIVKSQLGDIGEKDDIIYPPLLPNDSVCIAVVEIKVDKSDNPKNIDNKHIDDCRHAPSVNTDEFVSISTDDTTTGYLSSKLSNNGTVKFTVENVGASETMKADYSPGGLPSMEYSTDANIDNLDVSSIAPHGILYSSIPANRELRSLAGGVDNQVVHIVNLSTNTIKAKHLTGAGQQIYTEGAGDKTFGDYGGCTLICKDSYWRLLSII